MGTHNLHKFAHVHCVCYCSLCRLLFTVYATVHCVGYCALCRGYCSFYRLLFNVVYLLLCFVHRVQCRSVHCSQYKYLLSCVLCNISSVRSGQCNMPRTAFYCSVQRLHVCSNSLTQNCSAALERVLKLAFEIILGDK